MLPVHDVDVPPAELRFHHNSGRVSLDLVATIGERWRARFERLRTPADLDRWLDTVGLRPHTRCDVRALDDVRQLRGAIELLAVAAMAGEGHPTGAVSVANAVAARHGGLAQLRGARLVVPICDVADAAAVIARDAVDLFGTSAAVRVRECAADDCALIFLDGSRAANRRWCSMGACGNRRKVARHRARAGRKGTG